MTRAVQPLTGTVRAAETLRVVTLAGNPASAADTAYNTRSSLAAGTYTWKDCLAPTLNGDYSHTSYLTKSGSATATLNSGVEVRVSGNYTFGSLLNPQF